MFRTGNPALSEKTFREVSQVDSDPMTIQGTANKALILLLMVVFAATFIWKNAAGMVPFIGIGAIGGLIIAIVTIFKKEWAPVTAPIYAVLQGLVLGGISALFERSYPGIVIQAVGFTFGTLFSLLIAYKSRLIPVTQNFRLGIVAATGGILVFYLINFVMGFFGPGLSIINSNSGLAIGFSFFVVIIAALNLVLDFDFIERGAEQGAPKYMEWYGAFGLMVTLVWLYMEILRLLVKLRSR